MTEALLVDVIYELLKKEDCDTDTWTIDGVAIRHAVRLGYHRDPHLPNLSPFERRLRRRTFSIASTFDAMLSIQAGLPAIPHEERYDSDLPKNLFDTDFDARSTIITSRLDIDPTLMVHSCYKAIRCQTYRRITQQAWPLSQFVTREC